MAVRLSNTADTIRVRAEVILRNVRVAPVIAEADNVLLNNFPADAEIADPAVITLSEALLNTADNVTVAAIVLSDAVNNTEDVAADTARTMLISRDTPPASAAEADSVSDTNLLAVADIPVDADT